MDEEGDVHQVVFITRHERLQRGVVHVEVLEVELVFRQIVLFP